MRQILMNYRSWDRIAALFARHGGTWARPSFAVTIVDNDPIPVPPPLPPGLRLLVSRENRGFAAAVNQAARVGSAPWLLLINPDITADDEVFLRLESRLPTNPRVAAVGGLDSTPGHPRSFGAFPSLTGRFRRGDGISREANGRNCDPRAPFVVDWAAGSFLLLKRSIFEEQGGFDERYFMYFEDIDYGARLRTAGYQVLVDPALSYRHPGHGSYGGDGKRQKRDYRRSQELYLGRHGTRFHHRLYTLYRLACEAAGR